MDDQQGFYQSYILRMWQEGPRDAWRVTLEEIPSGKSYHFANLTALFNFILSRSARFQVFDPNGNVLMRENDSEI
jgi:hypothetical protein